MQKGKKVNLVNTHYIQWRFIQHEGEVDIFRQKLREFFSRIFALQDKVKILQAEESIPGGNVDLQKGRKIWKWIGHHWLNLQNKKAGTVLGSSRHTVPMSSNLGTYVVWLMLHFFYLVLCLPGCVDFVITRGTIYL